MRVDGSNLPPLSSFVGFHPSSFAWPGGGGGRRPGCATYAARGTSPNIRAERSRLSCGNLQCHPAENCSKRIYPYHAGYQLIDSGSPYLKEFLSVTI